LNNKTGTFVAI